MYRYVRNHLVFRHGGALHVRRFSHTDGTYLYFEAENGCVIGYPADAVEVLHVTPSHRDALRFAAQTEGR